MVIRFNAISLFLLFLGVFNTKIINSQDLVKKRRVLSNYVEDYWVLKSDKKIKHGNYIKFYRRQFGPLSLKEIGNYTEGEKTGSWYYFSWFGYLELEGKYSDNKKTDTWFEYYTSYPYDTNYQHSQFVPFESNQGVELSEDNELIILRENLILSAQGNYQKNKKIGIWEYFSRTESLLHKFNHNDSTLLFESSNDSLNLRCPFLGGCDRFYHLIDLDPLDIPDQDLKIVIQLTLNKFKHLSIKLQETKVDGKVSTKKTIKLVEEIESMINNIGNEFLFKGNEPIIITFIHKKDWVGAIPFPEIIYFN